MQFEKDGITDNSVLPADPCIRRYVRVICRASPTPSVGHTGARSRCGTYEHGRWFPTRDATRRDDQSRIESASQLHMRHTFPVERAIGCMISPRRALARGAGRKQPSSPLSLCGMNRLRMSVCHGSHPWNTCPDSRLHVAMPTPSASSCARDGNPGATPVERGVRCPASGALRAPAGHRGFAARALRAIRPTRARRAVR